MAPRVSEDSWSARDTNPDAIDSALRRLLRERHAANRALAPARVLNLIVVVDRASKDAIAARLEHVGRYEASRTILCTVEDGRRTLDATVVMSYTEPSDGKLGLVHEKVEIEMGGEHLSHLDTIVDPVLASELPTALWCARGYEGGVQPLLGKVDAILLDSDEPTDPRAGLMRAAELVRSAYVVDLAWLRTTPWRERLAASFDPPDRLSRLPELNSVSIRHRPGSGASGLLLAGWLASRLRLERGPVRSNGGVAFRHTAAGALPSSEVEIVLEAVDQEAPGLAGITVASRDGFSLSLDRAPGGLCARERSPQGQPRVWQVLGASRGEYGILGEGVRQAQLRDRSYAPALQAVLGRLAHLRAGGG
ncbi:MAG TPA: glucose-6-phosphate dehydrogenase assembly protein OpcA [Thermoleophilaceae bacterium]